MFSYISGRPSIHFNGIFAKSIRQADIFPFNQENCYFFFNARYALVAAIQTLGLKPGDRVLIPSYNCCVEIDPFLYMNVEPIFYRIKKDLSPDFEDLLTKISNTVKGILITHFLGFPQPVDEIKKICVERNIFLIEDCAHALLSSYQGKPLGSYGDISIFSLLKTLPVPHGGLLLLKNRNFTYDKHMETPSFFPTIFFTAELLKHKTSRIDHKMQETFFKNVENSLYLSARLLKLLVVIFKKLFNPNILSLIRPDSYIFDERIALWGISNLTKTILQRTDFENIKIIRQRNFQYLLDYFVKNRRELLLFKELPPSVCPLFFPLIVETKKKRDDLYITLKKRGIITHPWWDRFHPRVPWDAFPDAVYLKTKLFGLPIHQDLTLKHLDRVIEEFEKAYQGT